MKKFTLKHEINCSVEHFWKVFFDKEFNTTLYLNELRFPQFQITEQTTESDGSVRRRVRGTPKMNVPKAVAKLLGDGFSYEEEGNFDPDKELWSWKLFPNSLKGKLNTHGTVRIERIDDNKVRRIADIQCEAKVFGVGGLIESSTEKQMREGWDDSARYMNRWVKEHPAG